MAEYIDRESITKRLERVITQGVPNAMGTHSITAEYSLDVIRNLPAADVVERPRWIPVTERLPEDGSDILAVQSCCGEVRIIPANYDRGVWYDCIFNRIAEHITHWMPLPALS